jgi:predicted XRE-type DNA-binding protein
MSQAFFEARTPTQLCKLLGLPARDAVRVEMRRDLVIAIKRTIEANGWTHAEAAERAAVGRTVITAIVNGHIARMSTDRLIDIAQSLGLHVKLKVA